MSGRQWLMVVLTAAGLAGCQSTSGFVMRTARTGDIVPVSQSATRIRIRGPSARPVARTLDVEGPQAGTDSERPAGDTASQSFAPAAVQSPPLPVDMRPGDSSAGSRLGFSESF